MRRVDFDELERVLNSSDSSEMVSALEGPPSPTGRERWDREPIVRTLYAFRHMGMADTIVDLHWMLVYIPAFRQTCGFTGDKVPSRPTLSRVYTQMTEHLDLVEKRIESVQDEIKEYVPDLGKEVAVDSTTVETHANPNRNPTSDPEAGRTKVATAREGKKKVYGYKAHTVVDANYDIPLAMIMTPANISDTKRLKPLVKAVLARGYEPEVVIADRGYDAGDHSRWLHDMGIVPVIHKRRPRSGVHRKRRPDGTYAFYTTDGFPTCECGIVRQYLRTDLRTGRHLYGRIKGCNRGGKLPYPIVAECDVDVWVDPDDDPWLFGGSIRRGSREWLIMYAKRWSVERVFSRWKGSTGCLGRHYFRGRAKIELHTRLQMLAYLEKVLSKLRAAAEMPMAA